MSGILDTRNSTLVGWEEAFEMAEERRLQERDDAERGLSDREGDLDHILNLDEEDVVVVRDINTPTSHRIQVSPSKRSIPSTEGTLVKKLRSLDTGSVFSSPAGPSFLSSLRSSVNRSDFSPSSTDSKPLSSDLSNGSKHASSSQAVIKTWTPISAPKADQVIIVASAGSYQRRLDKLGVTYHIQWELSRLVAQSTAITSWDAFCFDDFDCLSGKAVDTSQRLNQLIHTVESRCGTTLTDKSAFNLNPRLLMEVDREEKSLRKKDLLGVYNTTHEWGYGGKIAYSVLITEFNPAGRNKRTYPGQTSSNTPIDTDDNPFGYADKFKLKQDFHFTLLPPRLGGKSFRLARRFGSRAILTFKISPDIRKKVVILDLFVGRVFLLFGRSFRALWAPPDKDIVIAVETLEGTEEAQLSFLDILNMYNDLDQDGKRGQAMAKWASRPQLLLSDSIPALTVSPSQVAYIDDISVGGVADPSTEQTLTDGCGLMSENIARQIQLHPHLRSERGRPSAVQIRFGGSKGLLALMSPEQHLEYQGKDIVIRKSMVKSLSKRKYQLDPSLLTLDVVRVDSMKIGTTLSSEPIIVMTHCGVPQVLFVKMFEDALESVQQAFQPTRKPDESEEQRRNRLISSSYGLGGVGYERKKRKCTETGVSIKVASLAREADDEDCCGFDPVSGQPISAAESLYETLLSGFDPMKSTYCASKLRRVVENLLSSICQQFFVPLDQSFSAFIVPDSLQLLRPDEIFVSFSEGPIDFATGCRVAFLEGPCLVYRSPCKLPTDVRKFTAVYRPELAHLRDCVVMSANGDWCKRSPASYLGGGDYDGDTVTVVFDQNIVEKFTNAPTENATIPSDFEQLNFDKDVLTGTQFISSLVGADSAMVIANHQHWLLASLLDDKSTGRYSDLHGNAVYQFGLDHEDSLRLARMFTTCLDARKSGLKVKPHVKVNDIRQFSGEVDWRKYKKEGDVKADDKNLKVISRKKILGDFIMDRIMDDGKERMNRILASFPTFVGYKEDRSMSAAWNVYIGCEPPLRKELDLVEAHVNAVYAIWELVRAKSIVPAVREAYEARVAHLPTPPHSPRKVTSPYPRESILDLATIWHSEPLLPRLELLCQYEPDPVGRIRQIKIACYIASSAKRSPHFLFDMDFNGICEMKAKTVGATKTITSQANSALRPSRKS